MRARLYLLELLRMQVIETQFEPVGVHTIHPPNMPCWHVDYFELKILEKQLVQEG